MNHPTRFGETATDPIAKKIMITILDGILMGAPSKLILGDIRNKWDVEASALIELIDEIDREVNKMSAASLDRNQMLSDLYEKIAGSNPLGLRFQSLQKRIKTAEREEKQSQDKENLLMEKRRGAAAEVDSLNRKMNRDLADWSMDHANELASEIYRRV